MAKVENNEVNNKEIETNTTNNIKVESNCSTEIFKTDNSNGNITINKTSHGRKKSTDNGANIYTTNNGSGFAVEHAYPQFRSLREIVEWLVIDSSDVILQSCFLLSYRVMFNSEQLYIALDEIIACSAKLQNKESTFGKLNTFLYLWGDLSYHFDWKCTMDRLNKLMELAKTTSLSPGQFNYFKQFVVNERRNRGCHKSMTFTTSGADESVLTSPPIGEKRSLVMKLRKTRSKTDDFMPAWFNLDPVSFAEQMTVFEHEISNVKAYELVRKKHANDKPSPVDIIAARFNEVSNWVSTQVLYLPQPKMQAKAIKRYVVIAEELVNLNNFQSAGQILSGLGNSSVSRLKRSWALLSNKTALRLKKLEDLMSPNQNYARLRALQQECTVANRPMIPYIPLLLRDLTFICDGNVNVNPDGSYNFDKLVTLGKKLLWFKSTLDTHYRIIVDVQMQKLLQALKPLSEDELYKLSLECEPKTTGSSPILTPTKPVLLEPSSLPPILELD